MTRMTGPDCAVMCNLINTLTHKHTHTTHKRCRRDVGNGGDFGGKRRKKKVDKKGLVL